MSDPPADRIESTACRAIRRKHLLLADTIAGSLVLLSVTGLLQWAQLHMVRTVAAQMSQSALTVAIWFAWAMWGCCARY